MLRGLNHITLAVRDLERSVEFYCGVIGSELHVKWDHGAYITIGDCWICLSLDPASSPSEGYSHIAFSIDADELPSFKQILDEQGVEVWKKNKSEGDSAYFLDPDGHRLEAHVGDLKSRLKSIRAQPYEGQHIYSDS